MKLRNLFPILVMAAAFVVASCGNQGQKPEAEAEAVPVEEHAHLHYIQVAVEGMTCEGCENTVKGAIEKVAGVKSASATHLDKYALAGYDEATPDTTAIREAVTAAGYTVTGFSFIGHDLPKKE
ncbi:MAG: heavy-metal-associated domain-containing protein [Bacteroidales bacterium]|nr:heavy-metal-associated domain-containing protein [Bacteroidales bacterium]